MTKGTHPPKTNMRLLIRVAEWRDLGEEILYGVHARHYGLFYLGKGAGPPSTGLFQVIESMCKIHRSPNLHPLIPPKIINLAFEPSRSVKATAL